MWIVLEDKFSLFLLALFLILFVGRLLSELAKKLQLPEITGELLAGVLLGPTLFGKINLPLYQSLFSDIGPNANALDFLLQLSLILVMFSSGTKIDLGIIIKQSKSAFVVSVFSVLIPFIIGVLTGVYLQSNFVEVSSNSGFTFLIFLGTTFAITALPVIVKILIDLKIIHTPVGITIVSSAVLSDIIGWFILALITQSNHENLGIFSIVMMTCLFLFTRTFVSKYILKVFDEIEKKGRTQITEVGLLLCVCIFFSFLSQLLSLHAYLGAFLAGASLQHVLDKHYQLKMILNQFIIGFFSPLFFVSMALKIDFVDNFDLSLVILIFIVASFSKIIAARLGAYYAGIKNEDAKIISVALNARGAMEIVFSTIALKAEIISSGIYVSLVFMAILTTLCSSVMLKKYCKNSIKYNPISLECA